MISQTAQRIAEVFDKEGFLYSIKEFDERTSLVDAGFSITCGPNVNIVFAANDSGNDVTVQVYGLMQSITPEKRMNALEACNTINAKTRFLKFYIRDDDLMGEYDLPANTSDECVADCCMEMLIRTMQILETEYHRIPESVFGGNLHGNGSAAADLLNAISEFRRNPVHVDEDCEDVSDQQSEDDTEDAESSALR